MSILLAWVSPITSWFGAGSKWTWQHVFQADAAARGRWIALLLVVLGVAALWIDLPVANFCLDGRLPGELRDIFYHAEVFGHAHGVLAVVATVGLLSSGGWQLAARIGGVAIAAGLAADILKLCIARIRPCRLTGADSVADSFVGIFAWGTPGSGVDWLDSGYHSLPSAHTATAVALAIGLATAFPRGRIWFALLALLTAANRIDGGAHFISDCCWGAAIGWLIGTYGRRIIRASPSLNRPLIVRTAA